MTQSKLEVMHHLAKNMEDIIETYLTKIDDNWQPTDFLPESSSESFLSDVKELQKECKELPYDYLAVLAGNIITEEALPTYESWLMDVEGISKENPEGWSKWIRMWTIQNTIGVR